MIQDFQEPAEPVVEETAEQIAYRQWLLTQPLQDQPQLETPRERFLRERRANWSRMHTDEIIAQIRERFIPLTQAHTILCLNEQYARRKVLENGMPEEDYFELWGRYLVDKEFLIQLRDSGL